jgi:hypothetical protein
MGRQGRSYAYVFLKEVIPVVCAQLNVVGRDRQTQLSENYVFRHRAIFRFSTILRK